KTLYYFDEASGDLFIKGLGDPLLVTETIERFSFHVAKNVKTNAIRNIVLDHSYFDDGITVPGTGDSLKPYNAHVGALSANFNTVSFKWNTGEKKFFSPEPLTPLFDIFIDPISKTKMKQGRIILSKPHSKVYAGFLIRHFLEKRKIKVTGSITMGGFKSNFSQLNEFVSPYAMNQVIEKLLEYSNNFIANQLFLSLGAEKFGGPATLDKASKAVTGYAKKRLSINGFKISEGSGISRENKIAPRHMINVLLEFRPFCSLLRNNKNDYYKTGTLNGVRTRAGYIIGEDNKLYPYAIMINKKNKGYGAVRRDLIKRVYRISSARNH
ncbi:MAG: D-alanyl-D-alanine carboxypeptidase, partial [Desulfobacteraceae bacterium]|nr:D-alanyl-D-alanine carboxypeptidase [Desulfobacteraceae bacterium]